MQYTPALQVIVLNAGSVQKLQVIVENKSFIKVN